LVHRNSYLAGDGISRISAGLSHARAAGSFQRWWNAASVFSFPPSQRQIAALPVEPDGGNDTRSRSTREEPGRPRCGRKTCEAVLRALKPDMIGPRVRFRMVATSLSRLPARREGRHRCARDDGRLILSPGRFLRVRRSCRPDQTSGSGMARDFVCRQRGAPPPEDGIFRGRRVRCVIRLSAANCRRLLEG